MNVCDEADLTAIAQGRAWPCLPHSVSGWRGPGRKSDFCPMATLQALRTFARLPAADQPEGLLDVARVSLRTWRRRGVEKTRWAVTRSCGVAPMLIWQMCARWPSSLHAWWPTTCRRRARTPRVRRIAVLRTSRSAEKAAITIGDGPLLAVLRRLDDLAPAAAAVDVTALASSKGGRGTAVPPRGLIARH